MADEKITYEIVVDDSQATGATKDVSTGLKNVSQSAKDAKGSAKELSDGLTAMVPGLNGVISGFKAMVASPVGLTLAAVATVFGVIKEAISRSQPALDFIEDIFNKISTVTDVMLENLNAVGAFFGGLLSGNIALVSASFNKLSSSIAEAVEETQRLNDAQRELDDQSMQFRISTADSKDKINALIVASKNRNLSFDEQAGKIKEAISLEKELSDTRKDLADKQSLIDVQRIANAHGIRMAEKETFDAFFNRVMEQGKLVDEEKEKLVGYYESRKQAASESLAFDEKAQNSLDAISERRLAKIEKETQEKLALIEIDRQVSEQSEKKAREEKDRLDKDALDSLQRMQAKADKEMELEALVLVAGKEAMEEEYETAKASYIAYNKLEEEKAKNFKKSEEEKNKIKKDSAKLSEDLVKTGIAFLGAATGNAKVVALANIAYDTGVAIAGLTANSETNPANAFTFGGAGALQFAIGLARILANIASATQIVQSHERGGVLEGPSHRSGGIPFTVGGRGGFEAEGGEAIINKRSTAMFRNQLSAINAAGGGVRFETGGITPFATSGIDAQILQDRLFTRMIDVMQATSQKVLVIEEFQTLQSQLSETQTRATF